jgi:uncharacterized membrane protein YphA (DoxX/SURF4 family)
MNPKISRSIAVAAGVLFIAAGALKLLLAARGGSPPGASGAFAGFLEQLGVPFPAFFAVAVPVVEVVGGAGLIFNRAPRLWAAALAGDMAAAIFLVGAPGKKVEVGTHSVGGEAWRLPLEVILLCAMLWLNAFPPQRKENSSPKN